MEYTLVFAPEVFTATFFGGPTYLLFEFQELYHECLDEMYTRMVSDDEQHVFLRCYFENPGMFDLHVVRTEEWPRGLSYFSD